MRSPAEFFARLITGIVLFFVADGVLFRTTVYTRYLAPDSSAGTLQTILSNEKSSVPARAPTTCSSSAIRA